MITFKEYLNEIAIKGKVVKAKKKVTETELRILVRDRDVKGLENADVSEVTDMSNLFFLSDIGSSNFNPDISDWDTSKVTNMYAMFRSCASLEKAPNLDTSNVINMTYMFTNCKELIAAPKLDTSNVTNMNGMFGGCVSMNSVPDFTSTSNVTDMSYMFKDCKKLTNGDISHWDVNNVETYHAAFYRCPLKKAKQPKFKD